MCGRTAYEIDGESSTVFWKGADGVPAPEPVDQDLSTPDLSTPDIAEVNAR